MTRLAGILFALFAVYSTTLIGIEWCTSQDYVRNFVADVEGPVPFYAANTTISVFLLWATALLFAVCISCEQIAGGCRRTFWFFASQVAVFALLGLDDRFKMHEFLARHMGIGDHFILIAIGVVEVVCLLTIGRKIVFQRSVLIRLGAATALFCVMLVFDAIVPHDAFLRLSIEDVAKTWAALFFCLFAWDILAQRLRNLPPQPLLSGEAAA